MARKPSLADAKRALQPMGWTVTRNRDFGEYRAVSLASLGSPGHGYFTPDLDDAVATAIAEHRRADGMHRADALNAREAERAAAVALLAQLAGA